MAAVLKRVLASHPGKGGGSRDFVRAKLTEASGAGAAIDVARKLVAG
jgi:hypothetical protein